VGYKIKKAWDQGLFHLLMLAIYFCTFFLIKKYQKIRLAYRQAGYTHFYIFAPGDKFSFLAVNDYSLFHLLMLALLLYFFLDQKYQNIKHGGGYNTAVHTP